MRKITLLLLASVLCSAGSIFAQHGWSRVNYPSSTVFTGIVTINNESIPAGSGTIGVFVNGECRMIADVRSQDDISYVSAVVHCSDSIKGPETATIKYWDASTNEIIDVDTTFKVTVHGDVRMFPINILKSGQEPTSDVKIEISEDFINAFPMPFEDNLTVVSGKEMAEVTVLDNIGKVIFNKKNIKDKQIDFQTSNLAEGMYFITIKYTDGTTGSKRVIKD